MGSILGAFLVTFFLRISNNFFEDFGTHSGSIWVPFLDAKSTLERLRCAKVDLQKTLFSLSKSILFELVGSPELPKSLPGAT